MISEEELEKFKKKNITDKTIIELENALRVSISITAKYQDKKKFKSYMLAVRCLQDEIIRLKRENEKIRKQNMYEHKYGSDMESKYIVEKAKNDRAIEYIQNNPLYTETYDYNTDDNLELNYVSDETASDDLLNILRGEDK